MSWPFEGLKMFSYDLIVADFPWHWEPYSDLGAAEKGLAPEYETMSVDDIVKAFPVGDLAARDAVYIIWMTNPMINQQISVGTRHGFDFVTMGTWQKVTVTGKKAYGSGYVQRCCTEHFAIFRTGQPVFSNHLRSSFDGLIREHSRKPAEAFRHFEELVPNAHRRIELFSRENRPGWDAWGNETGLFNDPIRLAEWKRRRKAQKRAARRNRVLRASGSLPPQEAIAGPLFQGEITNASLKANSR
jgi:N6-adenosine-specific RNA methylase IME4